MRSIAFGIGAERVFALVRRVYGHFLVGMHVFAADEHGDFFRCGFGFCQRFFERQFFGRTRSEIQNRLIYRLWNLKYCVGHF